MSQAIEQEIRTLRAHFWSARDPEGRAFAPLADAYRRKGDLVEARSLVDDGLARLPDFTPGYLVAARVHRESGEPERARGALDALLALDRENVLALLERAELARDAGDRGQAVADLTALLELAPEHLAARSALEAIEREVPLDEAVPEPTLDVAADPSPDPGSGLGKGGSGEFAPIVEGRPEALDPELSTEADVRVPDPFDTDLAEVIEVPRATFDTDDIGVPGLPESDAEQGDAVDLDGLDLESGFGLEPTDPSEATPAARLHDISPAPESLESDEFEPEQASPGQPPSDLTEVNDDAVFADADDLPAHVTRTMAELYVRQGLPERAIEVYEQLLERESDDDQLRARIAELRGDGPPVPAEPVEDATAIGDDLDLAAVAPQWAAHDDDDELPESTSAFGWEGETPDVPTPIDEDAGPDTGRPPELLSPAEGEDPVARSGEAAPAPSIRAHFDDLLAWVPGAVPIHALSPHGDPELAPEGSPLALSMSERGRERNLAESNRDDGGIPAQQFDAPPPEHDEPPTSSTIIEDDPGTDDDLDDFRTWLESLEP